MTLAERWLKEYHEGRSDRPLGIRRDRIQTSERQFAIPWQAQAFLDGDPQAEIIGTFPLIIDRGTGAIRRGQHQVPLDKQLGA